MSSGSRALNGEKHPCPVCGEEYVSTNGLKYHMEGCCPSELIDCPSCDQSYVTRRGVAHHHSAEHNKSLRKQAYECAYCGCTFKRYQSENGGILDFCSNKCKFEYWSENWVGENHHHFKPCAFDYGSNWRKTREVVLERDGHACQCCGLPPNELEHPLEVHHIQPLRTFDDPKNANDVDNLVSLCKGCHRKWEGIPLRPDGTQGGRYE